MVRLVQSLQWGLENVSEMFIDGSRLSQTDLCSEVYYNKESIKTIEEIQLTDASNVNGEISNKKPSMWRDPDKFKWVTILLGSKI